MQAVALERLTKRYGKGCRVLASYHTLTDVATAFKFQLLDIVALPGRHSSAIGTIAGPVTHDESKTHDVGGGGEWLYVLDDSNATTVSGGVNRAVLTLEQGEADGWRAASNAVRELLAKAAPDAEPNPTSSQHGLSPEDSHALCAETLDRLDRALQIAVDRQHDAEILPNRQPQGLPATPPAAAAPDNHSVKVVSQLGEYYDIAFRKAAMSRR
jgi:hypothetical protein